jgi:asparagine synthase (glutamine-hydrolysing)
MNAHHYIFSITAGVFEAVEGDLVVSSQGGLRVFSRHLSPEEVQQVGEHYMNGTLHVYLDTLITPEFFLVIYDKATANLVVANDKFGNNEIYYTQKDGTFCVANSLQVLFSKMGVKPEIDIVSAYELLSYLTILPPRTIYKDAYTLPVGRMLTYNNGDITTVRYWDLERRLADKVIDYEAHVTKYREIFRETVKEEAEGDIAVALSGGIDSGGILGVLTDIKKAPVPSISVGPQGKDSHDLVSARKTVAYFNSPNVERYPDISLLSLLKEVASTITQPIGGEVIISYAMLYREAKNLGYEKLFFGSGTQLLLGNLKSAQFEYKTRHYERFIPRFILNPLYRLYAWHKGFSENRVAYMTARTWRERFGYAKGALFTRERYLYKALPKDFFDIVTAHLAPIEQSPLDKSDAFVVMEVNSWVECQQQKDGHALARLFGIKPVSPFNTPRVGEYMLRTTDEMRRRNNWKKQLIRDMFKPFVPEHLYTRDGNSLLVPYTAMLEEKRKELLTYLQGNKLIQKIIDMEVYERDYHTLPEPGLSLIRLTSLALWYDAHHDEEHLKQFDVVIK